MPENFLTLWEFIQAGGVLAVLFVALVGGMRRWYVWSWAYQELERDRDWWRDVAMRSVRIGEVAVNQSAGTEDLTAARRIRDLEARLDELRGDRQ